MLDRVLRVITAPLRCAVDGYLRPAERWDAELRARQPLAEVLVWLRRIDPADLGERVAQLAVLEPSVRTAAPDEAIRAITRWAVAESLDVLERDIRTVIFAAGGDGDPSDPLTE